MAEKQGFKKTTQASGQEKRRGSRVRLVCQASYQHLKGDQAEGELTQATTLNISTTGILLRTPGPLELSQRYRLQIHLPGIETLLTAQAKVVRVEEKEAGKTYLAGFHIEQMEPPEPVQFLTQLETLNLRKILETFAAGGGSDLHLTTGHPPIARVGGHLKPLNHPPLHDHEIRALVYSIMTEEQIADLERNLEIDMSYSISPKERFRFNLHWQRGQVEATIRTVLPEVLPWDKLGVPEAVVEWIRRPHGLVLIAGPSRSGKTTTLNSLVDQINKERDDVIICLERPIEFLHQNNKSVIKQREIGSDTRSFAEAARRALRQDPDVVAVGEIEDAETAQIVLKAAESGNLVLASLHAADTTQAIDRFLSLCPPDLQQQVAFQLAGNLLGVVIQRLFPKEEAMGGGLVLATEIFMPTDAACNAIRSVELVQLRTIVETGKTHGMQTLAQSVQELFEKGLISEEVSKSL